jgi:hypothetical protein
MTKNRITIIITALAVTIGGVPATAGAKPNNGAFSKSGEAFKKLLPGNYCDAMRDLRDINESMAKDDVKAGDYASAFRHVDMAAANRTAAKKAGCGWAWV